MSRGFAFLSYTDQRSTILAVDNFNGIKLTGRIIRVDHVLKYTSPEELEAENAKKKGRHKYSDLVTEELFKSATGDLMFRPVETDALPSQPDLEEANSVSDENIQGKRQRTPREVELRKKFKLGQISEKDYMEEKRRLKKSIRQEAKRDL
jgi:RNA recognition motif-containing protein